MIRRLREATFKDFIPVKEAGQGKIRYPPDHQPGIRVPKGGSSCANCKFLGKDRKTCVDKNFIRWNGSKVLPAPADEYCSDWYRPKEKGKTA